MVDLNQFFRMARSEPAGDAPLNLPHNTEVRLKAIRADGSEHDLGVVAAHYHNPLKNHWWRWIGSRLAARRIRAANRAVQE
jgi:hypothetical protein